MTWLVEALSPNETRQKRCADESDRAYLDNGLKRKGLVIGLHYSNPHSLTLRRRTAKKRGVSYAVYRGLSSLEHVYCGAA
jgi:hypothetical protein